MAIKRPVIVKEDLDVTANVALELNIKVHPLLKLLAKENSVLDGFLEGGLDFCVNDWNLDGPDGEEILTLCLRSKDT